MLTAASVALSGTASGTRRATASAGVGVTTAGSGLAGMSPLAWTTLAAGCGQDNPTTASWARTPPRAGSCPLLAQAAARRPECRTAPPATPMRPGKPWPRGPKPGTSPPAPRICFWTRPRASSGCRAGTRGSQPTGTSFTAARRATTTTSRGAEGGPISPSAVSGWRSTPPSAAPAAPGLPTWTLTMAVAESGSEAACTFILRSTCASSPPQRPLPAPPQSPPRPPPPPQAPAPPRLSPLR
mmetsp:Transcript_110253/g.311721  ORF Transcript_110253/g.311721 Transcript_110253/m.311721 type:complete len:241 (+) Transcript_110253:313-1035(+)